MMTSAVTPNRPTDRRAAGFTLVELILVVALLSVMLGVVVVNLSGWNEHRRLDEGSRRLETMLYMARADAANRGKLIRLEFANDENGAVAVRILWEPKPFAAPGEFIDYEAGGWEHYSPDDLVEVIFSKSDAPNLDATDDEDATAFHPITFHPDGSSDSAEIALASTSAADTRRAVLTIDGLIGTVSRRIMTASQFEQEYE